MATKETDLDQIFQKWNPMEEAYSNPEFNLYDSGIGTATADKIKLIVKNLPKGMTSKSIKNLCERYGRVKEVETAPNGQSVVIKFHNIADMESVYRALKDNEYGCKVIIAKPGFNQHHRNNNISFEAWGEKNTSIYESSPSSSAVDLEKRKIRPAEKDPLRPKLDKTNLLQIDKENCAIPLNDPLHHVLKEGDAHGLERAGIVSPKVQANQYEYHTGRAFKSMSPECRKILEESHKKSKGTYDAEKEIYCKKTKSGKDKLYRCVVCNKKADMTCYRCDSQVYVYCSPECQKLNWEEHKKICGRIRKNDDTLTRPVERLSTSSGNSSDNQITRNNLKIENKKEDAQKSQSFSSGSSSKCSFTNVPFCEPHMPAPNSSIVMTSVTNTNLVFIRSSSTADNTKYFETISNLQMEVKGQNPLEKLPQLGQAVIAKFQKTNEYGRALVLGVTDVENIKINFLDYGNIETQKLSHMYNIPQEFMLLPRFAVPVILKDVANCYMTAEVRSFMYSCLQDKQLVVKYDTTKDLISKNNVYQVDLYDAANQHINKTIVDLCKPQEPKSGTDVRTAEDLEYTPLPVGKGAYYFIMDNSQLEVGCISCTTKEFALEIEKFSKDIQRYANSLPKQSYAPREEELCIAKYSVDGLWYRGRCLEKIGDGKPSILFIDYGNIALVKVADIRPYPKNFDWPILTKPFGIEGLPEKIDTKLVERLEQLLPCGHGIRCDFVEKVEENFYNVTLNEMIQKLKAEKLLN